MTRGFTRELTLGYNHVFQDGQISMVGIMEELEETASEHCRAIGQDVFSLLENNTAWVLKGGALKMECYPGYSKTLRIETWISSMEKYRGCREFLILDEEDRILGQSSSLWVFMDLKKRGLMPIPEVFHERWKINRNRPIDVSFRKKEYLPLCQGHVNTLALRRRDFDVNQHVHNIRYLEWITESIPSGIYKTCQVQQMEMLYRKEALSDNPIRIRTEQLEDKTFRHDITDSESGALLMSAKSLWEEKKVLYSLPGGIKKRAFV